MLSTTVYRGRLFSLGEFHCPRGSERWRQINVVEEPALVAFPGTSVVIEHLGRPPLLANQNHVMFYNHEQRYRRVLHDGRGDHCVFVAVELPLLDELLAAAGLELEEPALPFTNGPSDARGHLLLHLAVRELRRNHPSALRVDELTHEALDRAVELATRFNRLRTHARRALTERQRHDLVEAAKEFLTDHPADNLSLSELASALHASEFHLARLFRAHTGFSLHGYRTHLRLRLALERLDGEQSLSHVAHRLGFNSHSHFTDAFRSVFGVPPSVVRRDTAGELRRILEARLSARS